MQEPAACNSLVWHWSLSTTLHEVTFQRQLVIHAWISQTLITIFNGITCWDRRHLSMTRKERCIAIWNSLIFQIHILWFCRTFPTDGANQHLFCYLTFKLTLIWIFLFMFISTMVTMLLLVHKSPHVLKKWKPKDDLNQSK